MTNNPDTSPLVTPLPDFKDRSNGLVIFGILTLMLGCLSGLFVPLMVFGTILAPKTPDAPPMNHATLLPGLATYALLAVALIWLGIGSIQKRRWARAILLIFSWSWLITGILMTAFIPYVMSKALMNLPHQPKTGAPTLPPGFMTGLIIGMTLFFFVAFVLLPAVWTFFYNSRHVKATCEARDPVTRWTDACPLPVLAVSLWAWFCVPMMLILPLTGMAVMPCFGVFISGVTGSLAYLVIAAVWGWAGWFLYRLDARGWWLLVISIVLFTVSAFLTYSQHDISELYQLQGLPQAEIDHLQKMGLFTGNRMAWLSTLCSLPFLGYLLFIKKYLGENSSK